MNTFEDIPAFPVSVVEQEKAQVEKAEVTGPGEKTSEAPWIPITSNAFINGSRLLAEIRRRKLKQQQDRCMRIIGKKEIPK